MYTIEEFDKWKTKVLKYVLYKKRTEKEIKTKFKNLIDANMLEDIVEDLKSNGYIDDEKYIKRAIDEYIALRNLSIKEIKYKFLTKGINIDLIEDYIVSNIEELTNYERKSAENIILKKSVNMDETELKTYLIKKGYQEEIVVETIRKLEN